MLKVLGGKSTVSEIFMLLFWGCMPYIICRVPWLVQRTIQIFHILTMMLYSLAYCELQFLSLVGIMVCGCSWILQICACSLIGGDEFLIVWEYLDWFFPDVVICPTIWGGSLYLCCIVPLFSSFWTYGWLSLHFLICDCSGELTGTWCPWLTFPFSKLLMLHCP